MSNDVDTTGNKNVVLVMGVPSSGKTTSLMAMPNQNKIVYMNADMKELPFQSKLREVLLPNPKTVLKAIKQIEASNEINIGVLDTITFLMNNYERLFVVKSSDTQKAWGAYANFYREVIHNIKSGTKDYAIFAHQADMMNDKERVIETKVPVKGAVGRLGVEADFTTIIGVKRVPLTLLDEIENDLLTITDENKEDGFKYVFQTRLTNETVGERIRSSYGLWQRNELFIDNDLNKVFTRLHKYYANS